MIFTNHLCVQKKIVFRTRRLTHCLFDMKKTEMSSEVSKSHLNLLVEEVLVQTNLFLQAYTRLRETVANEETRQRREVWAFVQSALSHAAMISKYLRPSKVSALSEARAEALKKLLEVAEESPVFSRNARNNVEHLDERLDLWIEKGGERMLECVFDSRGSYDYLNPTEAGKRRWFTKRVYLIDEDTFMSEGRCGLEEIQLAKLMVEILRMQQVAERFLLEDTAIVRIHPQ